ncbi:MAG: twin-arginine translocation signal domain-containing protein [Terriglobia bacterium]
MKKLNSSAERGVTRRDFLRNAGAGLVAGELAGASPLRRIFGQTANTSARSPRASPIFSSAAERQAEAMVFGD